MQRFWFLAALMALGSPAHADGFSFSVGGHRVHVEASRYCRSTSCASVSIQSRRAPDRYDDDDRDQREPARESAPRAQTISPNVAAAPARAPVQPVAAPPAAVYRPAAAMTQTVAAPPPPPRPVQPAVIPPAPPPAAVARIEKPAEAVRAAPDAAPQVARVSHQIDDDPANALLGDWQTESKGTVRIAQCGRALCGYVLRASSNDIGEAVLINMKPKTDEQWSGSVYSQASGDTYYGTMQMKGTNTLRVEACALGRFYCSGNNWTRIETRNQPMMTSRQTSSETRS